MLFVNFLLCSVQQGVYWESQGGREGRPRSPQLPPAHQNLPGKPEFSLGIGRLCLNLDQDFGRMYIILMV